MSMFAPTSRPSPLPSGKQVWPVSSVTRRDMRQATPFDYFPTWGERARTGVRTGPQSGISVLRAERRGRKHQLSKFRDTGKGWRRETERGHR